MNKRDTQKALERRRLRGGRMLLRGLSKAEVARGLGVSATSAKRWAQKLERRGLQALKIQRRRGRPGGLDAAQRRALARELRARAIGNGFPTKLWTLPRVGHLIARLFGRRYSDTQVWRILEALNFSCQRPSGRALQRDENAIRQWKQKRWRALRKTPKGQGKPSSSSTSRG